MPRAYLAHHSVFLLGADRQTKPLVVTCNHTLSRACMLHPGLVNLHLGNAYTANRH